MPTTEELFKEMESEMGEYVVQDDRITLTSDTSRTMNIPTKYRVIGVESDERTERLLFRFPKIVGDNIDLSSFGIRVNYENANGEKSYYTVDDVEISGEDILFSWLLERNVTKYKGAIKFIVCAIKTDGRDITNEWNTTLASSEVLEGLEPKFKLPDEDVTEAELLIAQCSQKLTEMSVAKQNTEQATSKAIKATQDAVNATQDARDAIDQITKDSYLHTTLQSFVNKETVNPTSYGNVIVKELQGYAKQQKTNGYQLFDASKLLSNSLGGATVTNNGDGSFTVSGTGNLTNAFSTLYTYTAEEALKLISKSGTYKLSGEYNRSICPYFLYGLYTGASFGTPVANKNVVTSGSEEFIVTEEDIEKIRSGEYALRAFIYGASGAKIVPGNIKPMVYIDGDGTWEPFTGGKPAPSPDYPQFVHGLGDMGYFDGELLQGYYNASGVFVNSPNVVCSANFIPCSQNDNISVITEKNVSNIYVSFYQSDKTFISQNGSGNVSAPSNAAYFMIAIYQSGITPETAGHIAVTINNNYAVIFDTVGKNLFNINRNVNTKGDDYTEVNRNSVSGNILTCNSNTNYNVSAGQVIYGLKGKTVTFSAKVLTEGSGIYAAIYIYENGSYNGNYIAGHSGETIRLTRACKTNSTIFAFNTGGGTGGQFTDIQVEFGESATDYIPYQSSRTYIPISEPLYPGDKIYQKDMQYRVYRQWTVAVFDGSTDETWVEVPGAPQYPKYYRISIGKKRYGIDNNVLCNRFTHVSISATTQDIGCDIFSSSAAKAFVFAVRPGIDTVTDLPSWKTWLQSNPITVVYQIETPTDEPLSDAGVIAMYSLMACDELTNVSIAGVPDDAEVSNQLYFPRNVDGAWNTTAYALARKNEVRIADIFAKINNDAAEVMT